MKKSTMLARSLLVMMVSYLIMMMVVATIDESDYVVPPIPTQAAPYAEWAHHHWVWYVLDFFTNDNFVIAI